MAPMNDDSLENSSCVYFANVLNEILYGLNVDHEVSLGVSKKELERLNDKLKVLCDSHTFSTQSFSNQERTVLVRCSELCLSNIDKDEFDTRLGEPAEVAEAMSKHLLT